MSDAFLMWMAFSDSLKLLDGLNAYIPNVLFIV